MAQSPVKEIGFRTLEDNMSMIWSFCLVYWKKVTKGGPSLFQSDGMIIEPYDGLSAPKLIGRNHITILDPNCKIFMCKIERTCGAPMFGFGN